MSIKTLSTLALLSLFLVSCGNNPKNQKNKEDAKIVPDTSTIQNEEKTMEKTLAFDPSTLSEEPIFVIKTNMGDITIKLYKETPLHRDNFVKLASTNFYDEILFHRVIQGFMIQVGDPLTKDPANADKFGTGGPGYNVPAEINSLFTHKKGALAAARKGDAANPKKESSGSQFYIVQDEKGCKHLDGEYTIFGETIDGFDIIDKIAAVSTDQRNRPSTEIKILSILPK